MVAGLFVRGLTMFTDFLEKAGVALIVLAFLATLLILLNDWRKSSDPDQKGPWC